MKKNYVIYADAGHAWLKVKRNELEKLGIDQKISGCSYERGEWVYLEEDCDLSTFIEARGIDNLAIIEKYSDKRSKIRSYNGYSGGC